MQAPNTLVDEDVGYIDGIIRDFNAKLADFERLVSWFRTKRDVAKTDAVLNQEYNALMKRADMLEGTIQSAKDSINQLNNMVTNMTPDWLRDWLNDTNGNHLGLVPLLVGGGVVIAVGFLGAWITDAYIVAKKLEAQEKLLAAGGDPNVIARELWREEEGMFSGGLGTLGLVLLAGGAVYLYSRYAR